MIVRTMMIGLMAFAATAALLIGQAALMNAVTAI